MRTSRLTPASRARCLVLGSRIDCLSAQTFVIGMPLRNVGPKGVSPPSFDVFALRKTYQYKLLVTLAQANPGLPPTLQISSIPPSTSAPAFPSPLSSDRPRARVRSPTTPPARSILAVLRHDPYAQHVLYKLPFFRQSLEDGMAAQHRRELCLSEPDES